MYFFIRLIGTGIVSLFLLFFATALSGVSYHPLSSLLFVPGIWIAGLVFSQAARGAHYLEFAFAIDYLVLWAVLIAAVKVLESLFRLAKRD